MDVSGGTREGWMIVVPMAVLIFIGMYMSGGPVDFVNIIVQWGNDAAKSVANWIKHL